MPHDKTRSIRVSLSAYDYITDKADKNQRPIVKQVDVEWGIKAEKPEPKEKQ